MIEEEETTEAGTTHEATTGVHETTEVTDVIKLEAAEDTMTDEVVIDVTIDRSTTIDGAVEMIEGVVMIEEAVMIGEAVMTEGKLNTVEVTIVDNLVFDRFFELTNT